MALVLDERLILCCYTFSIISVANTVTINETLQVLMTIQKTRTVTARSASNTTLDPMNTTVTDTSTSSTISINCSKTTPYFIGLTPSAANGGATAGSGTMFSVANVAANTDKVPYQLNHTSAAGLVWGNTATDTTPGNGVTVTDTSLAQMYAVYAITPSANFIPDDYADTITVGVSY